MGAADKEPVHLLEQGRPEFAHEILVSSMLIHLAEAFDPEAGVVLDVGVDIHRLAGVVGKQAAVG